MALWFGVSVPLVFFGAYWGFRKPAAEFPVRTNLIPRLIPEQVYFAIHLAYLHDFFFHLRSCLN